MTKVLLLTPPMRKEEMFARGSETTASLLPPLGLLYIAGYIRKHEHEAQIMDGCVDDFSIDDVCVRAAEYDVVGVSIGTSYYMRARELIVALRKAHPAKLIQVGGPHVSAMPDDILSAGADIAVMGEGEATALEILDRYADKRLDDLSSICGIAYKDGSGTRRTAPRPMIANLDEIPMPPLELVPMNRYGFSAARSSRSPSFPLMATRGCNGVCTFCNHQMFGKNVRCHSPERVVAEFLRLRDAFGAKSIALVDDNFMADGDYVAEICNGLIAARVDIPFSVQARVDSVDEKKITLLKKAGCDYIAFGFESGSQRVLDYVNKRETLEQMVEAVRIVKKARIPIRGYFILGFPGETLEEMDMSVALAKKMDIDVASFSLLIPFPGTVEYMRAQKEGTFDSQYFLKRILPEFHFLNSPVFIPAGMTESQLLKRHKTAYGEYYFRLPPIIRKLCGIRSFGDIRNICKAANTLLKNYLFKV